MSNVEVRFTSCVSRKLFVRFYYEQEKFRVLICSIIPACFSRASANLRPGSGMCGLGAASPLRSALAKQCRMKHAGPPDFYGLSKGMLINFFIHPFVFYASEYTTYQLIAHSINHTHFVFSLLCFSFIKSP